jgi:hypothetical protein
MRSGGTCMYTLHATTTLTPSSTTCLHGQAAQSAASLPAARTRAVTRVESRVRLSSRSAAEGSAFRLCLPTRSTLLFVIPQRSGGICFSLLSFVCHPRAKRRISVFRPATEPASQPIPWALHANLRCISPGGSAVHPR